MQKTLLISLKQLKSTTVCLLGVDQIKIIMNTFPPTNINNFKTPWEYDTPSLLYEKAADLNKLKRSLLGRKSQEYPEKLSKPLDACAYVNATEVILEVFSEQRITIREFCVLFYGNAIDILPYQYAYVVISFQNLELAAKDKIFGHTPSSVKADGFRNLKMDSEIHFRDILNKPACFQAVMRLLGEFAMEYLRSPSPSSVIALMNCPGLDNMVRFYFDSVESEVEMHNNKYNIQRH